MTLTSLFESLTGIDRLAYPSPCYALNVLWLPVLQRRAPLWTTSNQEMLNIGLSRRVEAQLWLQTREGA